MRKATEVSSNALPVADEAKGLEEEEEEEEEEEKGRKTRMSREEGVMPR